MKTIVYDKYGPPDVLKIKEIEKPTPTDNEVLIKVLATTVTRYDCWARSCKAHTAFGFLMRLWFGIRKPKKPILGTELSGEIEVVGKKVKQFKINDPIYGYPGMNLGAYAEYVCLPGESVALKPNNITYEEAAAVLQGALTALFFLQRANIKRGQKILILGASGGVGMYSVQLAKNYFGAEVTGVCSTAKQDFVKSLGADKVIDYTKEDFTKLDETYDIIFDTFAQSSFSGSKVLKREGAYLFATYGPRQLLHMLWLQLATRRKVVSPLLQETAKDLILIRELIESEIIKPVVDKIFPFNQAAEAHQYFESGQKKGNIVIKLTQSKID